MVTQAKARPGSPRSADERHVILVSNRGPLEFYLDEAGGLASRPAGGGVATALSAATHHQRVTWIAAACNHADRLVAGSVSKLKLGGRGSLKLVPVPAEATNPYYNVFCNPILWFVQHSLTQELSERDIEQEARDSWQTGYLPVNRMIAGAVVSEIDRLGTGARVMLHDYHFYLAPRMIRRARPKSLLQHFIHIPWPGPEEWRALPAWLVRELCRGLLANDSLAFQTHQSVENFWGTCQAYLGPELESMSHASQIRHDGRSVHVWSNPISVDPSEISFLSRSPVLQSKLTALAPEADEKTIVRVDRLDPSKNTLRGFQAFELLLSRRPELRGNVRFLAFLVPSRTGIPEYDGYARQVFDAVEAINRRYGSDGWQPITVFYEQHRLQALAGLSLYDVLLVNSLADGMNLVSKEGPLINTRDGVLCLSSRAGSYEQLGRSVVTLDPSDVEDTSRALEVALSLCPEVRKTMASMTRSSIMSHQLADWLRHLLQDVELAAWRKEREPANA